MTIYLFEFTVDYVGVNACIEVHDAPKHAGTPLKILRYCRRSKMAGEQLKSDAVGRSAGVVATKIMHHISLVSFISILWR
jgi:hypothetical protein